MGRRQFEQEGHGRQYGHQRLGWLIVATVACGQPTSPPPPPLPLPADTDGTDGGMNIASPPIQPGSGLGPTHCRLDTEAEDTTADDGSQTDDGFKFDVGAPAGGTDFPVSCEDVEDTLSNLGCEFWAVDLPNDYRGTLMSPPAAAQQFAVVVANTSALEVAEIEVFIGGRDDVVVSALVEPGQVEEIALDPLDIDPRQGNADGLAYRVVSDVPITAYQFNPLDNQVEVYSNDASLLLPTHALAQDYTAVTGEAILLGMSVDDPQPVNAGAFVSVVATADETSVEIEATATIVGGPSSATLDRGQVLTVISDATGTNFGNLSGSRVTASRPVAVFSGNVATAIPSDGSSCCADHIEHQLPPHEAWGTAYAVAPAPSPVAQADDTTVYRITATFDDTELRYCPTAPDGAPERLTAGQTVMFATDEPFTVSSDPDKPFAVTQFLLSAEALSPGQPGDPAMIVLPGLEQLQRRYLFAVPAGYVQNFATIVARGEGTIVLDGEVLEAGDFDEVGLARGQAHSYVHVPVEAGAHLVEADVPVGVTVIGLDEAVSYGYPGGAGLRVIAIPPAAG